MEHKILKAIRNIVQVKWPHK